MKFTKLLSPRYLVDLGGLQVSPGETIEVAPVIIPVIPIQHYTDLSFQGSKADSGSVDIIASTTLKKDLVITSINLSGQALVSAGTIAVVNATNGNTLARIYCGISGSDSIAFPCNILALAGDNIQLQLTGTGTGSFGTAVVQGYLIDGY